MPTQCNAEQLEFSCVERRRVVAAFDGGAVSSDAGALLLGKADEAIGLIDRLAGCFVDARDPDLIEHTVRTLIGQRVFGMALGYEDLNDHEHLRHDPVFGALLGKLEPKRRAECAALAGKSTLNRLELHESQGESRYHKIRPEGAAIERLWVELFLDAHREAPGEIILDLDATDDPLHGHQEGRFFTRVLRRLLLSAAVHLRGRASAVREAAPREPRWGGRSARGSRAHRGTDPRALAHREDHPARRLGFLPRGADELV